MGSPLRRLFHWGPIAVLCIIKLITWAMVHLMSMWWPPHESLNGALHASSFLLLAAGTLYYFLQSLLEGPGYVPLGWKPENMSDAKNLQFCSTCEGYKAPRSHHCRKCNRCVMKMDHHCPWINSCVGHSNHRYFTMFLGFAVVGCLHATIVLIIAMYHALNRINYVHNGTGKEPIIYLTLTTLLLSLLAIGMAIGVVLAVGVLLFLQLRGIVRNSTTIEDWIMEKAISRREEREMGEPFVYPYNLGWKQNLAFVMWPNAAYDGVDWPLREGCSAYDLTLEQKAQKAEKLVRSVLMECVKDYSGRWVPLLQWPRAALSVPCSDEPRLPLREGDLLRVTRHRKYWLFGEKISENKNYNGRGQRGWFPRQAVVIVDDLITKRN